MDNEEIKWRRAGRMGRISEAATNQQKMVMQLYSEAFKDVKPGQLVRVLVTQSERNVYVGRPDRVVAPEIPKGEILMFLEWVEEKPKGELGDPWLAAHYQLDTVPQNDIFRVTGPVWLFRERIHFRVIPMQHLEFIQFGENDNGSF